MPKRSHDSVDFSNPSLAFHYLCRWRDYMLGPNGRRAHLSRALLVWRRLLLFSPTPTLAYSPHSPQYDPGPATPEGFQPISSDSSDSDNHSDDE